MIDFASVTDLAVLFMRIMVGITFAGNGYWDFKHPEGRAKSRGMSKSFTIFLAVAEMAGGAGLILGVLQQLAAVGLILIMLGAIQKKMFVWKTGFWGDASGWYYDLMLISTLAVIFCTNGGRFVLTPNL